MLISTPGIVLHSIKYGESGLVVNMLTRNVGLQTYFAQGVRKSKSRIKASLFRPLTLVDLVAIHKDTPQLQRIKEIGIRTPALQIGSDIRKTTIAIFMSELLLHIFRKQDISPATFDYIDNAVIMLDSIEEDFSGFHVLFMLQLSRYLGFSPARNLSDDFPYFSLKEGTFQKHSDPGAQCLDAEESQYFHMLSDPAMAQSYRFKIPSAIRKKLVHRCIDYYGFHISGFGELKSLPVLESLFS